MTIRAKEPIILVSSKRVTELIGVKPQTLRLWRYAGKGPRYIPTRREPVLPNGVQALRHPGVDRNALFQVHRARDGGDGSARLITTLARTRRRL
jgi:hypothetical protein